MEPALGTDLPQWIQQSSVPSLAAAGRTRQDVSPPSETEGRHARGETTGPRRPPGFASLLDQLYAGPETAGFEAAYRTLQASRQLPRPADRAAARERMSERYWYIDALARDDPWHVEDALEVIFRLTVIPDLSAPGVAGELARWADDYSAPAPVIKALSAAAYHKDARSHELMQQVLKPALGQRWLRRHGIYTGYGGDKDTAAPQARSRMAPARGDSHAPWRIFDGGQQSGTIIVVLMLFCAFLIVMLVLAILH